MPRVRPCEPVCGLAGTKEGNHSGPGGVEAVSAAFWLGYFGAGERTGVVKPPVRTLLPAVRAVAEGFEGSRKQGKSRPNGVVNAKKPLDTEKFRGRRWD